MQRANDQTFKDDHEAIKAINLRINKLINVDLKLINVDLKDAKLPKCEIDTFKRLKKIEYDLFLIKN